MCGICSSLRPYSESCDYEALDGSTITEVADAPHNTSTPYTMSPGDTFAGTVDSAGDYDWVAIELIEGHTYDLNVKGAPSGVGTLADPITTIYNSSGTYLKTNDDGGFGAEAYLSYTATYTGTHYVMARGYSTSTGTYQMTVEDTTPPPPVTTPINGDIDTMATYLTNGYWTDSGSSAHRFNTTSSIQITVNLDALTTEGQQLARWALEAWEAVANLDFVETSSSAKITFDDTSSGASANASWSGGFTSSATVNIGTSWLSSYGTTLGSYGFQTYLHEIGHALGLGHQGDYNGSATYGTDNTFIEDSWQASVMSYFNQTENTSITASHANVVTAMSVDVVAIQSLYGAAGAGSLTDGATVYGVGHTLGNSWLGQLFSAMNGTGPTSVWDSGPIAFTIFDIGGYDIIDFSTQTAAMTVDLRAEAISDVMGKVGNMTIARGTVIEEFRGGSGNDSVQGNSADNMLKGNGGNDTLIGDLGNDTLQGGAGADDLDGGDGIDTADYSSATADVRVDMIDQAKNYGDAAGDTLTSIENLIGSDFRDVFKGNGQVNDFRGGKGVDILDGRNGNDSLFGDNGGDRLFGGSGHDKLKGGSGGDLLEGGDDNDKLFGESGTDVLNGEGGDDKMTGGGKQDTFIYNAGVDIITDFLGDLLHIDDILWGSTAKSKTDVLGYASVIGTDTVFDFGSGNTLTMENYIDIAGLETVLTIV